MNEDQESAELIGSLLDEAEVLLDKIGVFSDASRDVVALQASIRLLVRAFREQRAKGSS